VQLLLLAIKPRVTEHGVAHVVLPQSEVSTLRPLLNELKHKQLISEDHGSALPTARRDTHCAYRVSASVLEEWERAARYESELRGDPIERAFDARKLQEHEVDEFSLGRDDLTPWLRGRAS
jgi:hypothetical protein